MYYKNVLILTFGEFCEYVWWDEERYERKTGGLNSIFTFWITFIKKV